MCHYFRYHHLAAGPCPAHNKRIELTTKAEPIFRKFKALGGFCVSSSLALCDENPIATILEIIRRYNEGK